MKTGIVENIEKIWTQLIWSPGSSSVDSRGTEVVYRAKTQYLCTRDVLHVLDFSLIVKAATLIFISVRGSAISSAK